MYMFIVIIEFLINAHLLHTGPAGTGKTESVKALGHQLGQFVLVFNCNETFDFQVQITCTSINFKVLKCTCVHVHVHVQYAYMYM